jgi:hypothetical protein
MKACSYCADLNTEINTAGQTLLWTSVDAGGAGDLGLSVFLGSGGRSGSESLESLEQGFL